jgi:Flp pilus assembly protein TadD
MRTNGQITAALLVAALAAAGCSKSDGTSQTKAPESQVAVRTTPVSMTDTAFGIPVADKGIDVSTLKMSFADGEMAYQAGDYAEATKVFEQYTADHPDNAWGHFMLGLSTWRGGDLAKSEKAFDEALRIDPDHVKSLVNLSRVLIDQGRFDEAFNRLMHAGEIDPNSAEVHRLLGRTYHAEGKFEEAMDAYRRAIALDDKDAWSMNNLGFLFLEQGRPMDAVPPLARAVELRKDVPMFHNNLGMALEHSGRFAAAAVAYRGALGADAGYEKAQRNLTRVEAVKANAEEPFDLQSTARGYVEQTQIPVDETTPEQ